MTFSDTNKASGIFDFELLPEEHFKDMKFRIWISDDQYDLLIERTKLVLGGSNTQPTQKQISETFCRHFLAQISHLETSKIDSNG